MIEEIRFVWFGEVTDDLAHSNNLELAPQLSMNFIASFTAVAVSVVGLSVEAASTEIVAPMRCFLGGRAMAMEDFSEKILALALSEQELSDTEEVECLVSGVGVASAEAAGGGGVMVVVASARPNASTTKKKFQFSSEKEKSHTYIGTH